MSDQPFTDYVNAQLRERFAEYADNYRTPTERPPFLCQRCGAEEDAVEITRFGDSEPRYIRGRPCVCPGPRCPCCRARLNEQRCPTLDCPIFGVVVPEPLIA